MPALSSQPDWEAWIDYFDHNAVNLMDIDWSDTYQLTPEEKQKAARSVQQFQLGESSEGNHVISSALRYVASSGDNKYPAALKLFIKEEQRHSQFLARFMHAHNI